MNEIIEFQNRPLIVLDKKNDLIRNGKFMYKVFDCGAIKYLMFDGIDIGWVLFDNSYFWEKNEFS